MQKLNGDYDNAILNFGAFISFYDKQETDGVGISKYENYREQAKIEKEGCLIALNQLSQPFKQHNFTVEQAPLSSEYNDYAPAVFNNDSSIVLTSGRGGKGLVAHNIWGSNKKDGPIKSIASSFTIDDDDEVMLVTDAGQLIRTPVSQIRIAGRATSGVWVLRTKAEERVVSVARLADHGEDDTEES